MAKGKNIKNIEQKIGDIEKISVGSGIRKAGIYLGNFIVGIKPIQDFLGKNLDKFFEGSVKIGNPFGALLFGSLDIARNKIPEFKENKYLRLVELGGTLTYGFFTFMDLIGILKGDFEYGAKLLFDLSMLYEVGGNTLKDYKGKNIIKDIKNVVTDVKNLPDNLYHLGHSK